MTDNTDGTDNFDNADNLAKPKTRRPLMFVVLGLFLLGAAGFLLNDRLQVHTSIAPAPHSYKYNVLQAVTNQVHYRQNSFFGDTPGAANTAYLSQLTDYINAEFQYNYRANEATNLAYQYQAVATVRGTFGSDGSDAGLSNVWTKQYQLLPATTGSQNSTTLSLDPTVQIPFADYMHAIDQFKNAFSAPINSQMVVTYTVRVSGKANGTPFSDTEVSTITAPLDQQVYKLAVGFTKSNHHEVIPAQSKRLQDIITQYELPAVILLSALGLSYVIYGLRKQIIKSPYQRELEKIYRYHDGIIIRASRPAGLANKDIVTVRSFNDLLNLEEEIKTPIIASEVSDATTHFLIARDDIVYVYTLGVPVPFQPPTPPSAPPAPRKQPPPKRKVMG